MSCDLAAEINKTVQLSGVRHVGRHSGNECLNAFSPDLRQVFELEIIVTSSTEVLRFSGRI